MMLNLKAILIAWAIGTAGIIGAYHSFSREQLLELVALKNGSAISDMPDGQRVMAAGRLDVPLPDRLPLRVNEIYQCHQERYQARSSQSSGYTTQERTVCDWVATGRFLPPFALRESGQRVPVQIINRDYQMEGRRRTVTTSATSRMVGWEQGDTVLVMGVTEHGAVRADTVYGGTRLEYLQEYSFMGWLCVLIAGIAWVTMIVLVFTG